MARKFKLNKKTLMALFDYNSFSPNKELERLAKESLSVDSENQPQNKDEPLKMESLEMLSAAGTPTKSDLPPEKNSH